MYKAFAALIGIIITAMLSINGVLAGKIGNVLTLPIIHVAGLIVVSLVLIFINEKKNNNPVPFYLNGGGLIGISLVLMNNQCFDVLGASLTLSLGIIGQTFGSVLVDSTGFLGLKKYAFDKRKFSGYGLLLLGVIIMTENWKGDALNIFFAFIAGALVILSMILNSQLSLRVGTFHGVRRNYMVGLICSIPVLLFSDLSLGNSLNAATSVSPLFLLGGGTLGVLVVAGSNKVIPRIPVVYTTLLIFGGQAIAGIVIDYFTSGELSSRKIMGVMVILLGLFLNMMIDKSSLKLATVS